MTEGHWPWLELVVYYSIGLYLARDNKSRLQKEPGPKVLSFSCNFPLRWIHGKQNDRRHEIIGVKVVDCGLTFYCESCM